MKGFSSANVVKNKSYRQTRLLIIEDNPDHSALIKYAINVSLPEVEPIMVTSEEEAFSYLEDCIEQEWKFPRLILLDLYMPRREDGWQILKRIKTLPAPGNQIPVIMFSHSDKGDDIREAYDRGGSSYLVKPLKNGEWLAKFQSLRHYWWETVTLPKMGFRF